MVVLDIGTLSTPASFEHRHLHWRRGDARIGRWRARDRPDAWPVIQRADIQIIIGVTLAAAVAIVTGNLLADLPGLFIDPSIKLW